MCGPGSAFGPPAKGRALDCNTRGLRVPFFWASTDRLPLALRLNSERLTSIRKSFPDSLRPASGRFFYASTIAPVGWGASTSEYFKLRAFSVPEMGLRE